MPSRPPAKNDSAGLAHIFTDGEISSRAATGDINFGSRFLTNVSIWPVGQPLPDAMVPAAAQVFAFDALISNDDRRRENQNILVRGDDIFVIDHETAFGFMYLIGPRQRAWECHRHSMQNHVFFFQLRRRPLSIETFTQRLAGLSDTVLEALVRELPQEWRHPDLGRISDHILSVRDHAGDFERNVLEVLA